MIAVGLTSHRSIVRANRWSSTGRGGARSMMDDNGRDSGQSAILGPCCGGSAARIGIQHPLRRLVPWRRASTITTSRAIKSP